MEKCAINGAKNPLFSGLNKPYSANNLSAVSSILIALQVYPEIQSQMRKYHPRMWMFLSNKKKIFYHTEGICF